MNNDENKLKARLRTLLSEHLGTEPEDIDDDSILSEDLHMKPTDLTDFLETLKADGFDTSKVDLTEIETFDDLNEKLQE